MLLKGFSIDDEEQTEEKETVSAKKEYPVDASMPDINNGIYGTNEFRMYTFKVKPCSRAYTHNWTECPLVHPGENARYRDLRKFNYNCVSCLEFRKGSCVKGDACEYVNEGGGAPAGVRFYQTSHTFAQIRDGQFIGNGFDEPIGAWVNSTHVPSGIPLWHNNANHLTPALQLSGSRLKTTLSARDLEKDMDLVGSKSMISQQHR